MQGIIQFECRRPAQGYHLMRFDMGVLDRARMKPDGSLEPPLDATGEERFVIENWGISIPTPDLGKRKRKVIDLLVPNSAEIQRADLFKDEPGVFLEFAYSTTTPEDVTALANRLGPLVDTGQFAEPELIY